MRRLAQQEGHPADGIKREPAESTHSVVPSRALSTGSIPRDQPKAGDKSLNQSNREESIFFVRRDNFPATLAKRQAVAWVVAFFWITRGKPLADTYGHLGMSIWSFTLGFATVFTASWESRKVKALAAESLPAKSLERVFASSRQISRLFGLGGILAFGSWVMHWCLTRQADGGQFLYLLLTAWILLTSFLGVGYRSVTLISATRGSSSPPKNRLIGILSERRQRAYKLLDLALAFVLTGLCWSSFILVAGIFSEGTEFQSPLTLGRAVVVIMTWLASVFFITSSRNGAPGQQIHEELSAKALYGVARRVLLRGTTFGGVGLFLGFIVATLYSLWGVSAEGSYYDLAQKYMAAGAFGGSVLAFATCAVSLRRKP